MCDIHYCDYLTHTTFRFYLNILRQIEISLPNFAFFNAKSPSVTQRWHQENALEKSKNLSSPFFFFFVKL